MTATIEPNRTDARIETIRRVIRQQGSEIREAYPILKHQDAIGFSIFTVAVAGVIGCAVAYLSGAISAWLCIPLVALLTSLLHELEHDLIHNMYFKKRKSIQNFMLLVGWLLRPGTINPWIRKQLHFLHHKVSGSAQDVEERGIGNGSRYGILRVWVMADTFMGNLVKHLVTTPGAKKWRHIGRLLAANFPVSIACSPVWYSFLGLALVNAAATALGQPIAWSDATIAYYDFASQLVVILIAPFYLRSFCLNFISSNIHYNGGVGSAIEQTQVMNAWYLWPLQLFCFNFGSTHGIHHFVVGETFYIRQLTAKAAHKVMRENGVRFNDMGTFFRANRYA